MPNHVKNIIRFGFNVPQERIDLLFNHVLSTPPIEEGTDVNNPAELRFDFNTLIPMPVSLNIECGSRMDEGILLYRILLDMNALGSSAVDCIYNLPDVKSYTVKHLERDMAAAGFDFSDKSSFARYAATDEGKLLYTLGEAAYNNEKNYGFTSWYDWSCKYWGTKWNSYDNNIDRERRTITFSTAWSCPVPIVKALASMFPDIDFTWEYADEDCGYNTGCHVHKDRVLSCVEFDGGSDAGYQMYVSCWGADDCMYQNENGAWRRYDCDDCPHKCY